jgi:BirA family biotin operon repressor/biotin-[acetyl-CoA-carboxylase] ligase
MIPATSAIDQPRLARAWQDVWPEAEVLCLAATASTNDDARALGLRGAPHGSLVIADSQSAGRGRRGASWIAPPGHCLLASFLLRPQLPPEAWPRLTHAAALAVCSALDAIPDLPMALIKWPNDVYLNDRKVCGILVESVIDSRGGFAVAGIGVNLNIQHDSFPEDLRPIATSVLMENHGQGTDRTDFAITLARALKSALARAETDFPGLVTDCAARSWLTGKTLCVSVPHGDLTGAWAGLGPSGELLLAQPGGTVTAITSADRVRPVI